MIKNYLTLPKNVYLLFFGQILGMSATSLIALTGGIIGAELAPSKELATLPNTAMVVGLAASIIPAAIIMKKIGRKKGFLFSTFVAVFATILAAFALTQHNFFLFCVAIFIIGTNSAFVQQYRFAAIESVPDAVASKAASLVLFAGVFSGILGPEIAKHTKGLYQPAQYAGSFIALTVLYIIASFLIMRIKDPGTHIKSDAHTERPLSSLIRKPHFLIAVISGATGFGIMTFIMTATPVHLHSISGYTLDETAFVIQSHIIAMFLPSLVTGHLIERFGVFKVLLSGLASFAAVILIGTNAHSIASYWFELVMLGVGWNFLFIGATVLLAKSYTATERFKAQGVNDFMVIMTQLAATFFAGKILFSNGWNHLHILIIPIIAVTLILFTLNRKRFAEG